MKKAAHSKKKTGNALGMKSKGAFLYVEVLQNGSTLASMTRGLKRRGRLSLTSTGSGPLVLPHYPFNDGRLDFLHVTSSGIMIDLNHEWSGFCSLKGQLRAIDKGRRNQSPIELKYGDYASMTNGDLRIMVRIGPAQRTPKATSLRVASAYRSSIFRLIMPSILEWQITSIASLMALVIFGSACIGLLNRPVSRPTAMGEIADEYILNFVSPAHLIHAPEALQKQLNRPRLLQQVMAFYTNVTASMMGWPLQNERLLLPTTVETYRVLQENSRSVAAAKRQRQQEIDQLQMMKNGVGLITIPSVVGESLPGSMLRVADKISILHKSFDENLAAKRRIQKVFPHDPEYAWEEYKNVNEVDPLSAATGKIKPFNILSEEELVYEETKTLAKRAEKKQSKVVSLMGEKDFITPASPKPIAIPDGVRFASFANQVDFMIADEKLYQLQAAEFGQVKAETKPESKAVIQEPLVGEIEPALIENYIKKNQFELQLCYELALRRNEQAAGTMEWRWRIDSRGTISDLALINTSIKDPRMTDCIRRKIAAWRFPRPRRGSIEVSYPFEFAPTKG
jgi:hypothetical protein